MCAAIEAHDRGARVTVLERASRDFRGGNSRHTRNLRTLHPEADGYVTGPYEFGEFYRDLVGVTGEDINRPMAELTIRESEALSPWMVERGARWQAPLKGTISLARTNHFFLGGGKSLLNAYYRTAADRGVDIHYDANVVALETEGDRCLGVHVAVEDSPAVLVNADAVVVAAGGFEANREWLREGWGAAADSLVVRGTQNNDGTMLRMLMDAGARTVGDPRSAHAIAVDARAPAYDAGIITRIDAVPIGIVVNKSAMRFADEGEEIWPKRYATWGRLIADQPGHVGFVIFDAKVAGQIIPSLYPPLSSASISGLASELELDPRSLEATIDQFNASCRPGARFDLREKDDCGTDGLVPPKSHWARPISTPPFYGYPLRTGITFTYMGVAVDEAARVLKTNGSFANVFAAGEIMAGNILAQGYLAGFGMTIGSVWGRIAGREAAACSSSS